MKKSTVRTISKGLNAFVVLMMILQPVGMPSILRAMAASDPSTEAVSAPAPAPDPAPKEEPKTEPAAPVVPKETPAPVTDPKADPTPAPKSDVTTPILSDTPVTDNTSSKSKGTTSPDAAATDKNTTEKNGQICLDSGAKITDSAKSDWDVNDKGDTAETKQKIELGVKYVFPGDENVSVTFSCLPAASADRTTLKIQQIASADINLPDGVSAASEFAYDITTGMKDGDFKYDLTLPKSDVDGAEVKYFEKTAKEAVSADVTSDELKDVDNTKVKEGDKSTKVSDLDHFTIYLQVFPGGNGYYNDWSVYPSGNKYDAVVTNDGDSTYISETSDNDAQTFTFPGTGVPAGSTINSVTINVVARHNSGSSNPRIKLRAEKGSHTYDRSDSGDMNLTSSYAPYSWTLTSNPFTHNQWTLAEVNAWSTRFGVVKTDGSFSGSGNNIRVTQISVSVDYSPALTVAINQASGQSDPTNSGPINFTAIFSEPVSGFTNSDLTIGGTAGGTKTAAVTGGPTVYNVAVSGMTGSGTVTASIGAGKAQSVATGNTNVASTSTDSTVTYDKTAPIISQVTPVPASTGDTTPNYVFSSTKAGPITVGGSCSIPATNAVVGPNTITFNTLSEGTYSNCTVLVTDTAGNASNSLAVSPFTISADLFDKGMVTFSFDDGNKSTYNNISRLGNFKSTQYIDTLDMIGATEGGGVYYTDYMTTANVLALSGSGHEIAAHSRTHTDLSTITDLAKLQFETDGSRLDLLQSIVGKPIRSFAYPFGTAAAKDKLKSAGFSGARTVTPDELNTKSTDRYALFARQVNSNTTVADVQSWIDEAVNNNKWLILVFHQIETSCPDVYCTTPSNLSVIVSYLQGKGSTVDVVTVSQGLDKMNNNPASDGKAPVITQDDISAQATSPAGAPVAFSPVVSDSDSGLSAPLSAFCTIPAEVEFGDSGVSFKTTVTSGYAFPMGATTVTCTAADTGGNLATKTFTVTVTDAIPPTTTLSTTTLSPTNSFAVPVTATFSKPVTGFESTDIVVANGAVADFSGSGAVYTFNVVPTADGTVTVDIPANIAQDSALNFNTAALQLSFISDRTAPVITIAQPDATPAISKTITASVPEGTLTMSVDAGSVCDGTLTFASYADTTFSTEADNGKTICYKAEDSLFNISYLLSAAIAGIDTTAPTAPANLFPDTGTPTGSIFQNWSWDASTDSNGIADYIYRVTGGASGTDIVISETSTGNTTSVLTKLLEGVYNFFVKAVDTAGNKSLESFFTLVVDTTAPVIAFHEDVTAEATSNAGATVTYVSPGTSDNYDSAGVATCSPVSDSTFALGNTTVTCTATDSKGNVATPTTFKVIVVDTIAPGVPVASPAAGDYMTDQSVTLSSADDGSGFDKIYFTTDGSDPDSTKMEYVGAITVDKDMTIKAIAYDKIGNASGILTAIYGIAPVISAETSKRVSRTKATIMWTTDDPATSRVVYDTVPHSALDTAPNYGYANSTVEADVSPKVTSHSVSLTGLKKGTTYYYRVISHGSPESAGKEISFKTKKSSSSNGSGNGGGGGNGGNGGGGSNNGGSTAGIATALAANGTIAGGLVAGDEQQNVSGDYPTSQDAGQQGEVLGEQQAKDDATATGSFGNHPYLYVLLGLIVLYILYFAYRKMSKRGRLKTSGDVPPSE
jgi:peptidoglycan/xylan/chitin deacetylase (PgdA/CDA1 family)